MAILDRVERMTSLVLNVPSDVKKISVIIEQKTADAEAALKREAAALENAITPEVEAGLQKLEELLSHIPGLSALVAAHSAVETVGEEVAALITPKAPASVAAASDAVPSAPIF